MMEEYKKEIASYLWKIPKMQYIIVNDILKLMDTEIKAWLLLQNLKNNAKVLSKTIPDEALKLALKVYSEEDLKIDIK